MGTVSGCMLCVAFDMGKGRVRMEKKSSVTQEAPEKATQRFADAANSESGGGTPEKKEKKKKEKDMSPAAVSRRTFVGGAVGAAVLVCMGGFKIAGNTSCIRPPGGQDEDRLVAACIRCQRCYEACPRKVIEPSHVENGVIASRTPTLNFEENYCDFCQEENGGSPLCVKNCPSYALKLEDGATAETTKIGLATIDEYQCLAYRDTGCRECYKACPYEAIELTGTEERPRPVVLEDVCTGCGACEAACVSLKNGSIASGVTERAITVKTFEEIA